MTDEEAILDVFAEIDSDDAEADAAPIEMYERCGALVSVCGARAMMDAAGCNSRENFPKVCVALAAASETTEEADGWRELMFMPRYLVLGIARAVARQKGLFS